MCTQVKTPLPSSSASRKISCCTGRQSSVFHSHLLLQSTQSSKLLTYFSFDRTFSLCTRGICSRAKAWQGQIFLLYSKGSISSRCCKSFLPARDIVHVMRVVQGLLQRALRKIAVMILMIAKITCSSHGRTSFQLAQNLSDSSFCRSGLCLIENNPSAGPNNEPITYQLYFQGHKQSGSRGHMRVPLLLQASLTRLSAFYTSNSNLQFAIAVFSNEVSHAQSPSPKTCGSWSYFGSLCMSSQKITKVGALLLALAIHSGLQISGAKTKPEMVPSLRVSNQAGPFLGPSVGVNFKAQNEANEAQQLHELGGEGLGRKLVKVL